MLSTAGTEGPEAGLGEEPDEETVVGCCGVIGLTFMLSSCCALQSFSIADYTLTPGQATKVKFTLRPMGVGLQDRLHRGPPVRDHRRGALAIGQNTDIAVSNARWGVNGQFGGPIPMGVENNLVTALGTDCASSGLNFADITGVTWKAFATPVNKNDRGVVNAKSVIDADIRAKAAAVDAGENYTIMGVAGAWQDDGDGNPEDSGSTDDFYRLLGDRDRQRALARGVPSRSPRKGGGGRAEARPPLICGRSGMG